MLNHYGPTETTVGACVFEIARDASSRSGTVPIGMPLANVGARVLDEAGELAPIGVPGELFIGGAGVARGYLGRPDLTAERFLHDPFVGNGARMYRTADRARRLPSGDFEFLGRLDGQVKIRGYRVELAEIEAVAADTRPSPRAPWPCTTARPASISFRVRALRLKPGGTAGASRNALARLHAAGGARGAGALAARAERQA